MMGDGDFCKAQLLLALLEKFIAQPPRRGLQVFPRLRRDDRNIRAARIERDVHRLALLLHKVHIAHGFLRPDAMLKMQRADIKPAPSGEGI